MSVKDRQRIAKILNAEPVLLHAADYGLLHRPRIYYGLCVAALCANPRPMPMVEVIPPGKAADGLCVIRWTGPQQPSGWKPREGFEWRYRIEVGTRALPVPGASFTPTYPSGRFLTLTTAFPHPADRPPKVRNDRDVFQRFLDDDRMQPLYFYVRGNMLWRKDTAVPLPVEDAEAHGVPARLQ